MKPRSLFKFISLLVCFTLFSQCCFGSAAALRLDRPKAPLVIQLSDVHADPLVQKNLSQRIQQLCKTHRIDLLAVEGAYGTVDLSRFTEFEDQKSVRAAADHLLEKNVLAGPVHAVLQLAKKAPAIEGIDPAALYNDNRDSVRDAFYLIPSYEKALASLRAELNDQKKWVFNADLIKADHLIRLYRDGQLELHTYAAKLVFPNETALPNVDRYLRLVALESSFSREKAKTEQLELLSFLRPRLTSAQRAALANQSTQAQFNRWLIQCAQQASRPVDSFQNFSTYAHYHELQQRFDADAFLSELAEHERRFVASAIKNQNERILWNQIRLAHLADKLIHFTLPPAEWKEYSRLKSDPSLAGRISGKINLRLFENFYEIVSNRDESMAKALISQIKARSAKTVIAVTGGYHSAGLTARLRAAGIRTDVILPDSSSSGAPTGHSYLKSFLNPSENSAELYLALPVWKSGKSFGLALFTAIAQAWSKPRLKKPVNVTPELKQLVGDVKTVTVSFSENGNSNVAVNGRAAMETSFLASGKFRTDGTRVVRRTYPSFTIVGILAIAILLDPAFSIFWALLSSGPIFLMAVIPPMPPNSDTPSLSDFSDDGNMVLLYELAHQVKRLENLGPELAARIMNQIRAGGNENPIKETIEILLASYRLVEMDAENFFQHLVLMLNHAYENSQRPREARKKLEKLSPRENLGAEARLIFRVLKNTFSFQMVIRALLKYYTNPERVGSARAQEAKVSMMSIQFEFDEIDRFVKRLTFRPEFENIAAIFRYEVLRWFDNYQQEPLIYESISNPKLHFNFPESAEETTNHVRCPICDSAHDVVHGKIVLNGETALIVGHKEHDVQWMTPRPSEKYYRDMYSESYFPSEWDANTEQVGIRAFSEDENRRRDAIANIQMDEWRTHGLLKPGNMLEVGPGAGHLMAAAAKRGWAVQGVEFSEYAANRIRDEKKLPVFKGTLEDYMKTHPEALGTYDLIAAYDLIEHVIDPNSFLETAARLLKKGGKIVLRVPNNVARLPRVHFLDHNWHFTPRSLNLLLKSHGFLFFDGKPSGIFSGERGKTIENMTMFFHLTYDMNKPKSKIISETSVVQPVPATVPAALPVLHPSLSQRRSNGLRQQWAAIQKKTPWAKKHVSVMHVGEFLSRSSVLEDLQFVSQLLNRQKSEPHDVILVIHPTDPDILRLIEAYSSTISAPPNVKVFKTSLLEKFAEGGVYNYRKLFDHCYEKSKSTLPVVKSLLSNEGEIDLLVMSRLKVLFVADDSLKAVMTILGYMGTGWAVIPAETLERLIRTESKVQVAA